MHYPLCFVFFIERQFEQTATTISNRSTEIVSVRPTNEEYTRCFGGCGSSCRLYKQSKVIDRADSDQWSQPPR
ncbi:hypothetical protein MGG_15752 [Pyricularia oryzae 70-15]|uniref:Uncharacterized protein n=2 Tax=Pyricularia oryzae TaxID=318829 RepID=G4MUF6_PYRO7|nr:uncharacterized protein MGG_15752 [Pyricularia oryzae 70-15]EHA54843.1 hypothetical protein MGG_15752 [Pyricularia oryzae 70-15]